MSILSSPQNCHYKQDLSEGCSDSHQHGDSSEGVGADSRTLGWWSQAAFIVQACGEVDCTGQWAPKGKSEAALLSKSPPLGGEREIELRSRVIDKATQEELEQGENNSCWGFSKSKSLNKASFGMGMQELNFDETYFCSIHNHIAVNRTHSSTHIDWREI